jgi:hypothetical protein
MSSDAVAPLTPAEARTSSVVIEDEGDGDAGALVPDVLDDEPSSVAAPTADAGVAAMTNPTSEAEPKARSRARHVRCSPVVALSRVDDANVVVLGPPI